MKNVLEWLEATVEKYPDKPAFSDTECSITFAQVYDIARNTGAYLIEQLGVDRTPVAVFAGRKMVTPAYFLGVVYAGRPYAPIDASLPDKRIEKILENLCPRAIVADRESLEHVESIVDDGSMDGTLDVAKELAVNDSGVKYISFSRNFGKEAAMYAGLQHAVGEYVAIMDADLQDPPDMLPEMYKALMEEGYDAVGTRRVTRKGEPAIRSFFARKFYRLMSRISKANMVDGARDYRLMNRKYVDALLSLKEYNRFSKGLFGWVGFKVKWLEFENVNRVAGETKWSFWQLFLYSLDGIVAFSNAPLYMASIAGVFSFIVAIIAMLFIIIRRLVFGDPVAGWASTVVIILFIGGIQLLSIGILGLYLSKLYLEAKDRPIYLIGESNIEKPTEKN
jgi:glycosyltransferase involved in cell wall biosynthesis